MAKKPVWRRCLQCMERFEAPTDFDLGKLFESHFVTADGVRKCMGEAQRKMSFIRQDNAWVKR